MFCKNSLCNIIVNPCFVLHFGSRNFVFGETIERLLCAMQVNPRGRKQMMQHSEPLVVVLSVASKDTIDAPLGIRVQLHTSRLGNFGGMDHVIGHFIGAVMRTTCALFLVFFFFFLPVVYFALLCYNYGVVSARTWSFRYSGSFASFFVSPPLQLSHCFPRPFSRCRILGKWESVLSCTHVSSV